MYLSILREMEKLVLYVNGSLWKSFVERIKDQKKTRKKGRQFPASNVVLLFAMHLRF